MLHEYVGRQHMSERRETLLRFHIWC